MDEFAGQMTDLWAYTNKVTLAFSRPDKPTDNAYIESLNGSFRDECLNCHWFESLADAKLKIERFVIPRVVLIMGAYVKRNFIDKWC